MARVEVTDGKEAASGAMKRGILYVVAAIGFGMLHAFLKSNHIGGVLIWGPFYAAIFFTFPYLHKKFRIYKESEAEGSSIPR
jgi:hypothetical protein